MTPATYMYVKFWYKISIEMGSIEPTACSIIKFFFNF